MDYITPSIAAIAMIIVSLISWNGGKAQRANTHADTIIDLTTQVQQFSKDLAVLRNQVSDIEHKNQVLWQYVYTLLEQLKKNRITPIKPPVELESDPQIIKIFSKRAK
jgi:hypothetical protein